MTEDYSIGVWETALDLNLSDESIESACKTDAPTCVMVFDLHSHGGRVSANPHQSPNCRLCDLIELYAAKELDIENITTYSKDM